VFQEPGRDSIWRRTIFKPDYDPFDVVQTLFRVRAKNARVVPFNPFRTQRLYMENISLRNIVVKPRQVGSSTVNLGIMTANAINVPNLNTLIVTHRDDTTATMRSTIQNFIAWLNEYNNYGLEIGKDNENELEIKTTGSWIFFATAGGKGGGRSRTIHQLLASELAHWNSANPGAELGSMTESVPDTGFVVVESTPNGAEGTFYDLYHEHNGYKKHFFPWFIEPSRRIKLGGRKLHLTEDEQLLVVLHNLDHEQIAWRRNKIRELKAMKLDFAQEYPEDDVTCWTAGTMPYFPGPRMNVLLRRASVTPYASEDWEGDPWDQGGTLKIWEHPRDGVEYVIGADVGGGHRDGDLSVASVLEKHTLRHVATLSGWWKPQTFADLGIRLAERYNHAYLGFESNTIGQGAVDHAAWVRKYPNLHWETRARRDRDGTRDEWTPGFYIGANQRTPLLNLLLDLVVDGRFASDDHDLIRQMTAARLERGRVQGGWADHVIFPKAAHDDRVMSLAQAIALARISISFQQTRALPAFGS